MSRKEEEKISKEFADLIAESYKKIRVEPIFNLLEHLASLSPYEIMVEARKDGEVLTLEQAKDLRILDMHCLWFCIL